MDWAPAGAMLIAGVLSAAAVAAPITRDGLRNALPEEAIVVGGGANGVGDALQEVLRTGPGFAPNLLGIDDGFLTNASLQHSELREEEVVPPWLKRAGPAGGPDIFRETVDNALRSTREAFFDSIDTASVSVGGVEVNVTLRGDRRGISINGFDLLGASPESGTWRAPVENTPAPTGVPREDVAVGQRFGGAGEWSIMLMEVRKIVSNPMTVVGLIALAGVWVLLLAADRGRRG